MSQKTLKSALTYGILPLLLAFAPLGNASYAAVKTDLKYKKNQPFVVKAGFSEAKYGDPVLDWRNPQTTLSFDIPDNNWTDSLEFLISADPRGQLTRNAKITVSFNDGPDIPIRTQGKGFDARITLDKSRLKKRGNSIRLSYQPGSGGPCVSRQDGGWDLNLKHSTVIITARERLKDYRLGDIEDYLKNEFTKPGKISLFASGPDSTKLHALAAQAIGLRMESLPEFTLSKSADFAVLMGTREALKNSVPRDKLYAQDGARIFVHKNPKPKIVLTGDTDAQVLELAKAFSRHKLPGTRRQSVSLGELSMQRLFSRNDKIVQGKTRISDFDSIYFGQGWGPRPQTIKFDVLDPKASHGQLLLRIGTNSAVSSDSNGQSIGYTRLDKTRKSVAFDLPAHLLKGRENTITLTPALNTEENAACGAAPLGPGLFLGDGSHLTINTPSPSQPTALGRFAASGGVFAQAFGEQSEILLPTKLDHNYESALKVIAKLGQITGTGWSQANFLRSGRSETFNPDKNILVIAPRHQIHPDIRAGSPKTVRSLLRNKSGEGMAAIYPADLENGKIHAILTNGSAHNFSTMSDMLISEEVWDSLEGSISYWSEGQVHMAQMPIDAPGVSASEPKENSLALGRFKLPDLNAGWNALKQGLSNNAQIVKRRIGSNVQNDAQDTDIPPLRQSMTPATDAARAYSMSSQITAVPIPELRGFSTPAVHPRSPENSEGFIASSTTIFNAGKQRFSRIQKGMSQKLSQNRATGDGSTDQNNQFLSPRMIALIAFIAALFLLLGFAKPVSREL